MGLRAEIFEQPAAVARLLEMQHGQASRVAARLRAAPPAFVFIAVRGSSDNAALYAKYLWGSVNKLPLNFALGDTLRRASTGSIPRRY